MISKETLKAVAASAAVTIITLTLFIFALWHERTRIFEYFAKEYTQELLTQMDTSPEEDTETQDRLSFLEELFSTPKEEVKEVPKQQSIESAVSKADPAVVAISITKRVPKYKVTLENVSPFPGFSFQVPTQTPDGYEEQEIGSGSGFLVTSDGMIVTNRHVASDTDATYTAILSNGKRYTATVLARDTVLDIAVLDIQGSGFPYLSFGDSESLKLGQTVIAIGNALGQFQNTVSVGIVSGLSRSIIAGGGGQTEALDHVIQTDAAINPGNSGGPLLDSSGRVVGVNVAVAVGSENIGFAIPGNSVKNVVDSVRETGKIVRPYMGIRYVDVTSSTGLSVDYGILIKKGANGEPAVLQNSPASKAGLKEGDVILEIDSKRLDSGKSFSLLIQDKKVGNVVRLKVLSGGVEKTVSVVLEASS